MSDRKRVLLLLLLLLHDDGVRRRRRPVETSCQIYDALQNTKLFNVLYVSYFFDARSDHVQGARTVHT